MTACMRGRIQAFPIVSVKQWRSPQIVRDIGVGSFSSEDSLSVIAKETSCLMLTLKHRPTQAKGTQQRLLYVTKIRVYDSFVYVCLPLLAHLL